MEHNIELELCVAHRFYDLRDLLNGPEWSCLHECACVSALGSEFSDFCNPLGVICMFSKAQHATQLRNLFVTFRPETDS